MTEGFQTVLAASDEERRDLFVGAADRLRTNEQNIEKDFWVCWTLDALFNGLEAGGPRLLFKGGTSLSKGYSLIERFSEDIDITVFREDIGQPATVEELESLSGKKRNARLEAIKAACQDYIHGPMLERLSALLRQTLESANLHANRARVETDPADPDGQSLLLWYPTATAQGNAYIRQILRQVQERGETAIVYDPAMDFVGEFYDPNRGDLILNPLDARCPYWSLEAELLREETATTIAAAFLPDKEYEKAFFTDGPRRILAHLLKYKSNSSDLLKWMSDPEEIASRVKGTPLAALIDPTAPAQRAGVISSLNMVADSLELLPEYSDAHGKTFSTAEWHTKRKRWVFLTSNPGYREKILPLHSVWLDLFILHMMGYCEDRYAKPVWFVIDELASLNKLPQLHTAVTENRKYGNPVVLGFQGRSQMEKRYGKDTALKLSQVYVIHLQTALCRPGANVSCAGVCFE
jgi:hypothetical protein